MQLNYNLNPAAGRKGLIADQRAPRQIVSKLASGLVVVGRLCSPGADSQGVPSLTGADANSANPGTVVAMVVQADADPLLESLTAGIPIFDSSREPYTANDEYSDKDSVPVLRKGPIWVETSETVVQYGLVYVWVNPAGGDPAVGSFATSANGGKCVRLPGAQWVMSRTGAGLAVMQLNFT